MPITNQDKWRSYEEKNTNDYGGACVKVARQVMEILDEEPGDFDTHQIICRADDEVNAGGITGFMAGCVAIMVSKCHSRGEEFRRKWNKGNQIHDEGDKANESGGVLNPAVLVVNEKSG
ncbi:hypothetical protein LCGC14_1369040 [marine sediment metagenome]|uniref:Uncharacterized protein n=1 Tax=marine sediment metagenome TaxID=412755 RepID=A0A0F9K5X6_9ZZZZ